MKEKYNDQYENKIILLAESKIKSGNFKVFDNFARVIKRDKFPELVEQEKTDNESCLVIINREGETIVITPFFEVVLRNAVKG
jgi:hypothetical protein